MSIGWQDIPEMLSKQENQLSMLQKDLQSLKQASLRYEAHALAEMAQDHNGIRLVRQRFENRPLAELRLMAEALKQLPDLVSYLASYDGQKLSIIVTCGAATGKDARLLLTSQLTAIQGRGGGDASLAQGGGVVSVEQYPTFLDQINLE
jgi:alanyl-tRNA synthetase